MAPLKQVNKPLGPSRIVTRTAAQKQTLVTAMSMRKRSTLTMAQKPPKRKADCSPHKETGTKRTAMGDITNAKKKLEAKRQEVKKVVAQAKILPSVKTVLRPRPSENVPPHAPCINGIVTRAAVKGAQNQTAQKPKEVLKENNSRVKTRLSNEFEKTAESLYSTALEDAKSRKSKSPSEGESPATVSFVAKQLESKLNLGVHEVPEGVLDFDKENWDDVFQVSHYAMDVFNYLKSRELQPQFQIPDYMERQVCLTSWMRSLLVDWMVEVQESFELNHETLYLGVKLVDMYLSRMTVSKETLQLVGAAAIFVASKYDERIPPLIDDYLYICDGAYTRRELVKMEINLLKVCDFNLGVPLSYRFLRRYARCGKVTMPVLTLARYVLEHSLMDYATVTVRDSKLAAASLYLALRMKKISGWTPALVFYSGYDLSEIKDEVVLLNNGLHRKPKSPLMTVRNKYSHKVFFEVATTPLLSNSELSLAL